MTSSEDKDKAIAFYKNRLDLALAHQKEMTTLFFKVTIGYFAILYGVFLIYKILYDTHFKDVDLFLYLILFFFSVTFFSWALRSVIVLHSLDLRVIRDQENLDRSLYESKQCIRIPKPPETSELKLIAKNFIEDLRDEDYRKISFEHNSQTLFFSLGIIILIVPLILSIYTITKMPLNVLFEYNLWNWKLTLNWQWISTIFSLSLLAINISINIY